MGAPTPPPERTNPTLVEQARNAQQLYSNWLYDEHGDRTDQALRLDDFLSAACDLLERITGQSNPPSTLHVRPPHGTQEMYDMDCRCDACRDVGAPTPPQ